MSDNQSDNQSDSQSNGKRKPGQPPARELGKRQRREDAFKAVLQQCVHVSNEVDRFYSSHCVWTIIRYILQGVENVRVDTVMSATTYLFVVEMIQANCIVGLSYDGEMLTFSCKKPMEHSLLEQSLSDRRELHRQLQVQYLSTVHFIALAHASFDQLRPYVCHTEPDDPDKCTQSAMVLLSISRYVGTNEAAFSTTNERMKLVVRMPKTSTDNHVDRRTVYGTIMQFMIQTEAKATFIGFCPNGAAGEPEVNPLSLLPCDLLDVSKADAVFVCTAMQRTGSVRVSTPEPAHADEASAPVRRGAISRVDDTMSSVQQTLTYAE